MSDLSKAEPDTVTVTITQTDSPSRSKMAGPCWIAIAGIYASSTLRTLHLEIGTIVTATGKCSLRRASGRADVQRGSWKVTVTGNADDTVTVSLGSPQAVTAVIVGAREAPEPNAEKPTAQQDVLDSVAKQLGRGRHTDIQRSNASYIAEILLAHGGDIVPRAHIRTEWLQRYPEDRGSRYPLSRRMDISLDEAEPVWWHQSDGTIAAKRVRSALRQLATAGVIARTPEEVTVLDRDLLHTIAQQGNLARLRHEGADPFPTPESHLNVP